MSCEGARAPAAGTPAAGARLPLSVIVPAYRCAATLRRALIALRASDLPRDGWELLVVDDGSGDDTPAVARAVADDVVVVGGGPRGPAHARNCGAARARGEVLVFVDADVCVRADALRRMLDAFADADVGAVFGAYDAAPAAPGVVSRFVNLQHRFVHVAGAGDAETFWAGCGAVRRDVFHSVGGFDARRYRRPQIEDVELGHRIRDRGWRIVLRPEIQGTHLKRWTLRGLIVTSVRDRGVPWMELMLAEGVGARRATLSVSGTERVATALVGLAGAAGVLAVGDARWLLAAAAALTLALLPNARLLWWLARVGGPGVALAAAPLRVLQYMLNVVSVACALLRSARARNVPHAAARSSGGDAPVPPAGRRASALSRRPRSVLLTPELAEPPVTVPQTYGELSRVLTFAFAPMHKRAFGVAIGTATGLLLFVLTVASLQLDPTDRAQVGLLSHFFAGYSRSWRGALTGLLWGLFVGFVVGWFTAFVRNLLLAVWLVVLRMRADLDASREFLDHV